jgi:hypothetical protein
MSNSTAMRPLGMVRPLGATAELVAPCRECLVGMRSIPRYLPLYRLIIGAVTTSEVERC